MPSSAYQNPRANQNANEWILRLDWPVKEMWSEVALLLLLLFYIYIYVLLLLIRYPQALTISGKSDSWI